MCAAGQFAVTNVGFSGFQFNGGSVNPTLSLTKGTTYTFTVSSGIHPFRIIGDTTAAYVQSSYNSFAECSSCVVVSTGGTETTSGTVTFTVPLGATASTVGYVCTLHAAMKGSFNLVDPTPVSVGL